MGVILRSATFYHKSAKSQGQHFLTVVGIKMKDSIYSFGDLIVVNPYYGRKGKITGFTEMNYEFRLGDYCKVAVIE